MRRLTGREPFFYTFSTTRRDAHVAVPYWWPHGRFSPSAIVFADGLCTLYFVPTFIRYGKPYMGSLKRIDRDLALGLDEMAWHGWWSILGLRKISTSPLFV